MYERQAKVAEMAKDAEGKRGELHEGEAARRGEPSPYNLYKW